ncbi:MAG: acyl carrier protein [Elusimicrobia bacterium]|nr:acyl carrier protein [Elusimicrobiota bacterium]
MISEEAVRKKILSYLEAERPLPCAAEEEKLSFEFLDSNFVDSIKIVELVTRLEEDFGVRFEPEDMQSVDFRTVKGMTGIILRLASR